MTRKSGFLYRVTMEDENGELKKEIRSFKHLTTPELLSHLLDEKTPESIESFDLNISIKNIITKKVMFEISDTVFLENANIIKEENYNG